MNKKGIEQRYLVGLLIVVASLVVLFISSIALGDIFRKNSVSDICRFSVIAADLKGNVPFTSTDPCNDLECESVRDVIVGPKEVFLEEIGKDLTDCSYQYYDGRIDFLDTYAIDDLHCFICYIRKSDRDIVFSGQELKQKIKLGNVRFNIPDKQYKVSRNDELYVGVLVDTRFGSRPGRFELFVREEKEYVAHCESNKAKICLFG